MFSVGNHSTWAQVKGWQCRLELSKESLEWEALQRDVGKQLWGFLCKDIPGFHSSHLSWKKKKKSKPPHGKSNDPILWDTAPLTSPLESCSPHPAYFGGVTSVFCLLVSVIFFSSFFPSILYLNPHWGESNIHRLRVCQRQAICCSHTIYSARKQTGTYPSRESHRNTLPVFEKPKLWALEASLINLLGSLPCWVQWKTPGQTQDSVSRTGEHTHHTPWSLKGTCHGWSSSSISLDLARSPLETVRLVTSLKLRAGWQAETGRGGLCGDLGHLLTHPCTQCW